jgi:dihydroflavonol-4-reductase
LVESGAAVTALVRGSSSRLRLQALGVRCVLAPLDDGPALVDGCRDADVVIHLAGAVDFGDSWDVCREVNIDGTRNLIAAARRAGVRRIVHTSSIVAVGARRDRTPLDESAAWNLGVLRVPYITTKREAEQLALSANTTGLEVVAVNPGCVIGPDDFTGSEFGTLCRRFWRGRVPFYFAGGSSFVDVRDVAAGILLAGQHGEPGTRYILAGHNRTHGQFFAELAGASERFLPRLPLPVAAGRAGAWLTARLQKRPDRRPYLSPAQSRLLGLYFFYDCRRARQIGYSVRPLAETLADAHTFWVGRPAA